MYAIVKLKISKITINKKKISINEKAILGYGYRSKVSYSACRNDCKETRNTDVKRNDYRVSKVSTTNITCTVSITCSIVKHCRSSGQIVKSKGEVLWRLKNCIV